MLASALLFLTTGCIEYDLVPGFPTQGDLDACLPEQTSGCAGTQSGYEMGSSVEVLSLGASLSNLDAYRYKVAGAPGDAGDDLVGYVKVTRADLTSGWLDLPDTQTLTPNATYAGSTIHFGWSVLSAEIRDCQLVTMPNSHTEACGQELLVGAPNFNTASNPGKVFWYRSDLQSSDVDHTQALEFVDLVPAPAGLFADANFGAALAAPKPLSDPEEPWNVSGVSSPWVAIGAPGPGGGNNKVYLYAVNPAANAPLSVRQTLTAPRSDSGFGEVLAVGDFDGDGAPDLAVGGPHTVQLNSTTYGTHVWVYFGNPSYDPLDPLSMPLSATALEITPGSGLPRDADEYGAALAAGPFWGEYDGRDQLVIGVPGVNGGEGAVCQVAFNTSGTAVEQQDCFVNPHSTQTTIEYSRWGASVVVGNFYSADADGAFDTPTALHPEVAVGRPDYNTERGRLDVFLTDEKGIDPDSFVVYLEDSAGPETFAHFGETVASGYVQESHWEDLVIGSPNRGADVGAATLTKAEPLSSRALDGVWLMDDVNGTQRQITIATQLDSSGDNTTVAFNRRFSMAMHDSAGNVCTGTFPQNTANGVVMVPFTATFTVARGTVVTLPGPATGASSQTWTGVDAEPVVRAVITGMGMNPDSQQIAPLINGLQMDVTIQYTAGTPSTGSITMTPTNWPIGFINTLTGMNSSCTLEPSGAMLMEQISVFACE